MAELTSADETASRSGGRLSAKGGTRKGLEPPHRSYPTSTSSVRESAGAVEDIARAIRLAAENGRWDIVERLAALVKGGR